MSSRTDSVKAVMAVQRMRRLSSFSAPKSRDVGDTCSALGGVSASLLFQQRALDRL